jgi:hypothetical protein
MKKNLEIGIYDYLNMDIPFDKLSKPRNRKERRLLEKRESMECDEEAFYDDIEINEESHKKIKKEIDELTKGKSVQESTLILENKLDEMWKNGE